MPKKNAKSKRADAERAAEWYAHEILECIVTCRAVRTRFCRQDLFASDVIGKRKDGSCVYIQVTAGQDSAVSVRRKKLERIPWLPTDIVQVLRLIQTENPSNARRKDWWFRVYTHIKGEQWHLKWDAISVSKEWFKAYKNRKRGEK